MVDERRIICFWLQIRRSLGVTCVADTATAPVFGPTFHFFLGHQFVALLFCQIGLQSRPFLVAKVHPSPTSSSRNAQADLILYPIRIMSMRFSTKLCGRQEPERGCLARITCSAPKDSSPILQLPPEIRAAIFNYIVGDVDLVYKCTRDFTNFHCLTSWSDYNRKLSFLQVCKLFRAEAWTLIQVKSVTFERSKDDSVYGSRDGIARLIPDKFGPQEIPLPLCRVRPHLREIRVDPNTLTWMLETNFLSTFPKLQRISVYQTYGLERRGTEFRQALDSAPERREILRKHLDLVHTYPELARKFNKTITKKLNYCKYAHRLRLNEILDCAVRETHGLPITLEATTEYCDRPSRGTQCVEPVYPILANVSSVKMVVQWNSKQIESVDVNMWNQPMEMAVKSKYTERIALTEDEMKGVDTVKALE